MIPKNAHVRTLFIFILDNPRKNAFVEQKVLESK